MSMFNDTPLKTDYPFATCPQVGDLLPPVEIKDAAEMVSVWMESNGYKNWQLGGICDRRIVIDRDEWKEVANGSLLETTKQLDAMLDVLRSIAASDWKTSGELRKMAREAYSSVNTNYFRSRVDSPE